MPQEGDPSGWSNKTTALTRYLKGHNIKIEM